MPFYRYFCIPKSSMPMVKTLLTIVFSTLIVAAVPTEAMAEQRVEIIENDFGGINVVYSGSVLRVSGADGETLQVYNVAGVRVMHVKVEGDEKHFDLNLPKGCYIVKVGKFVRKISVK